jgi:hypothetical protein
MSPLTKPCFFCLKKENSMEGRAVLNFSQWGHGEQEIDEIAEIVREGTMPPRTYLLTHPEARLNLAEKAQLIKGLQVIFGVGGEDKEGKELD